MKNFKSKGDVDMKNKIEEESRKKRIILLLFFLLAILGVYFYDISDRNTVVLYSGIVALVLYACMAINRFFRKSFSQNMHKLFCISVFIAGIVFLFSMFSAIEKIK